ncbi:S8 family serine peptidase [Roseibium litorale]|uniref:S8 family serine peptidase n=1 Tax=Roseibium litorale TaxID=2803841 RepID=A0ABR9CNS0_9HYPH|nr:S8 family serine peptidase [Roseibium litorale]MBD8891911.1 S8 family serine peptidase [Roseibium litorale]
MTETVRLGGVDIPIRRRDDRVLCVQDPAARAANWPAELIAPEKIGRSQRLSFVPVERSLDKTSRLLAETGAPGHFVVAYEFDEPGYRVPFLANGKINMRFRPDVSPERIDEILEETGLQIARRHPGDILVCQAHGKGVQDPVSIATSLLDKPELEFVEPDFVPQDEPSDRRSFSGPAYDCQWHLHGRHPSLGIDSAVNIDAEAAWRLNGYGSEDIIIAVMDDGFDLTNPDLQNGVADPSDFLPGFYQAEPGAEIAPADLEPWAERDLVNYHGTPCAGIAIGRGSEVAGVAPGCRWMPVRFAIGDTDQETILAILSYISARADVLSCSWASKPSSFARLSSTADLVMGEIAASGGRRGKGLVIVFAAGNDDLPTRLSAADNPDGFHYYQRGKPTGPFFRQKDIYANWVNQADVISVGAVSHRGRKSLYSNWGSDIHVVAPSDNFHPRHLSTRSDYGSINIATTDNENHGLGLKDVGFSNEEHGFITYGMGGTSAAAPMVAGVCALVLSADPALSAGEVKDIIARSASRSALDLQTDEDLLNNRHVGGAFDPDTGRSPWFGFGLINAADAVRLALEARIDTRITA